MELKYFSSFFEFLLKFVKLPDLFSQSQYVVQKYLHFWSLLERVDIPFSKPKLLDRYRNQIRLKFHALFFHIQTASGIGCINIRYLKSKCFFQPLCIM